jgi:phosphopantetheinyl transferase (holo-ACP synthase)
VIVGIGLDLVATARMERSLRGDEGGFAERAHVTLSHEPDVAAAVVVLEG